MPDGMALAEERLPKLLPNIAIRVPGGVDSPDAARRLHGLFNSKQGNGESSPLFVQMLRPHNGKVHFLYFWRAFAEVARMVTQASAVPSASSGAEEGLPQSLTDEVESLRDRILDRLWEGRGESGAALRLHPIALEELLKAAMLESAFPDFWREHCASLKVNSSGEPLCCEWLSVAMMAWYNDALAQQPRQEQHGMLPEGSDSRGLPVMLNVYDVSQEETIQNLNSLLAHELSPVKFGGVFHAGVEVCGLEWSYGQSLDIHNPGVSCCEPRMHPQHHYREAVELGYTTLSQEDVADLITELIEKYPGHDYDLLRRNCCHFAEEFALRLEVGGIPSWVHRLAYIGAQLENAYSTAQALQGHLSDILCIPLEQAAAAADAEVEDNEVSGVADIVRQAVMAPPASSAPKHRGDFL